MIKTVAIIAATKQEVLPLLKIIKKNKQALGNLHISFHYTGVSTLLTTFYLSQLLQKCKFDVVLQVGIAGAFNTSLQLSEVVVVQKEFIADVGVEENNTWKDMFTLGFIKPNIKPFTNNALVNKWCSKLNKINVKTVVGVTVNTVSTATNTIEAFTKQYQADIETMEGAALHYICNYLKIPYLQIRGISNYVGERDKKNWQIIQAIENSNKLAFDLILNF